MSHAPPADPAVSSNETDANRPWWKLLNRYHWFVFLMASAAWLFDCLDQQLFILARNPAIASLLPKGTAPDVLKQWGGISTAVFVAGWATGGLIFGAVGDRIGRARTLTLTVLLYSVCTGLSALSQGVVDFCFYRFITGLGVGGFSALPLRSLPTRFRTGLVRTLSAHCRHCLPWAM